MRHIIISLMFLIYSASIDASYRPLVVTPEGMEKCFGIAAAGQNDGPFMAEYPEASQGPGRSRYDCERTAYRFVPKGKCTQIMIGFTEDGTALTGTLEPRPIGKDPVKCMPYTEYAEANAAINKSINPDAPPEIQAAG